MQVAVGLRSQGFISKVEVWWGPSANSQPWELTQDGPLVAIRISFTGELTHEVSSFFLVCADMHGQGLQLMSPLAACA
jgi:hypothetical protein